MWFVITEILHIIKMKLMNYGICYGRNGELEKFVQQTLAKQQMNHQINWKVNF